MTYQELIAYYGTQAETARQLGLAQPSIHEWQHKTIPYDKQCQIQIQTGGRLIARKKDDARFAKKHAA